MEYFIYECAQITLKKHYTWFPNFPVFLFDDFFLTRVVDKDKKKLP